MTKPKHRTLFYRRVAWIDGGKDNMEKRLRNAHNSFNTTQQRSFPYAEGEIQGLRVESKTGVGLFGHVASYVPHQPTSLVPFPSQATAKDTSPHPPPSQHNYMEGDIFFLVKGNHMVLCPSGAREAVAISYISHILRKADYEELITRYSIEPVADVDKMKLLHQEGVKKISMNASLYEASEEYIERKTTKMTLLHGMAEEFIALFGEDDNRRLHKVHDMENLTVRVEVSFDSRKKGGEIGRERLETAAKQLINDADDEGFAITTGSGKRLTASEVRLSEPVQLPPHGNSISRLDAWQKLEEYMADLRDSGMLEQ